MSGRLACRSCGQTFALDAVVWHCGCGGLLDLVWSSSFDREQIAGRKPTMWRYREALPIPASAQVISFDEGMTPLLAVDFGRPVWVKQDHLFPSGSYKDRGAAVLISHAVRLGVLQVVEDSSGNAGCAIAAYCARAGIRCAIYVPAGASPDKLVQIERYGAQLHRVPGSREDTARAVLAAAASTYYASHSWNPFFLHGTKTFAFEVCEQLGWRAPDTVILPAGNGTLLLGAVIGFQELLAVGIISRLPRLIAVQAAACAPLYRAWQEGRGQSEAPEEHRPTMAEGIAIANPIRGPQILAAVRASGGAFLSVGEDEIAAALDAMCRAGFYIEPTAAATAAGVFQYVRQAAADEIIVSAFTGHGLKATDKMRHGEHEGVS